MMNFDGHIWGPQCIEIDSSRNKGIKLVSCLGHIVCRLFIENVQEIQKWMLVGQMLKLF